MADALTRPVVRAGTGFHRDDAPRLRCQETEKLHASDGLAKEHMPGTIRSMHLEHVLRDVQTDRGNLLHGRLLRWQFDTVHLWHTDAVGGGPPHHSTPPMLKPKTDGGYGATVAASRWLAHRQ